MKNKFTIAFFLFFSFLYANDIYQIKNNVLFDEKNTIVKLNQNDNLEALPNGKQIKFIVRIENSWNYTFYFFDKNGKQTSFFNVGNKYELPWVVFSPNEDFIVLEDGTWIIRSMEIYAFPSFTKTATQIFKRYFFWIGDYLYFNSISNEKIEGYPADDNNYCFLSRYNPNTKKIEVLIKWNECNQYEVKAYQNNVIELENKYVINKSDWKDANKWKTRTMIINIMDCSFLKAFVNDDLVRFRNEPSIASEKISSLNKNDQVFILSRTKEMVNVDDLKNYWYQVQDSKGIIGYIFGYYISLR